MGKPAKKSAGEWRGVSPNAEKPYVWASRNALARAVEVASAAGVAVYIALCQLEARCPTERKGSFFASLNEIGSLSGISARRVGPHIDALCDARLIERAKPTGQAKIAHQSCRYTILSRADKTSSSDKSKRPVRKGQKVGGKTSDKEEVHGSIAPHEESSAVALASANAPGGATPSGSTEGKTEESIINTWE